MIFSTLQVLIIHDDPATARTIEKCLESSLTEIKTFGYSVHQKIIQYSKEKILSELISNLKECDLVIVIGGFSKGKFVTYQLIADACQQELEKNDQLRAILTDIKPNFAEYELSIPKYSKILANKKHYPIIYFNRIFVLTDQHVEVASSMNNVIKLRLQQYAQFPSYTKVFKVLKNDKIKKLKYNVGNNITIHLEENDNDIDILASSDKMKKLNTYKQTIASEFGLDFISSSYRDRYQQEVLLDKDSNIQFSINCVVKCFANYNPENVFISFNGGKDCTVLLHLMLTVLKNKYPAYKNPICCMYIQDEQPFPELNQFIQEIAEYYNLQIIMLKGDMKLALAEILRKMPNLKACFMGTRRMDPFAENLKDFQMTDNGWPAIMRVNPLLDWDYGQIWDYLLYYKVPYCTLYDDGYTSLGNINNTQLNPDLQYNSGYLPAYKLFVGIKERSARKSTIH